MVADTRDPYRQRSSSSSNEARALTGHEKSPADTPAEASATEAPSSTPNNPDTATEAATPSNAIPKKKTYVQSLALFTGRKTDESYWKLLLRPFPLFVHPAFLWACLVQGTMIGWTVFIGVIIAEIFMGPPYFWGEVLAGYTYVGPFVGAVSGFLLAGAMADWSVKFMTRRNNGIYEPEFRILLILPMLIVGGIGMYGFGITASEIITGKYSYYLPIVFFGFQVSGMVIGAVGSSLYIVDAYRDLAIEGFTMMIIFKNFFSFVLTFYAFDWVTQGGGIRLTLDIISSIQVAVCLTSVPMYIFGKRVRAWHHKHDLLEMTKLR